MDIKISTIKDLNKVLLFTVDLSRNSSYPSKKDILHAASSTGFGDKKGHQDTLDLLIYFNFLSFDGDKYQFTETGKKFLNLNTNSYVEILNKQKRFLLELLIRDDKIGKALFETLQKYDFSNEAKKLLIDIQDLDLTEGQVKLLNLFKWLGLFELENGLYSCDTKKFKKLLGKAKQLNLEELLALIKAELKYSKKAEALALKFEKERLNNLGKKRQSDLVKIVAESNILLGFDLLSFNGNNSTLQHDRFIEVKCSIGNKLRFFWSINEFNVAKSSKEKYWIYFYPEILTNSNPLIFNNPAEFFTSAKYRMSPTEFLVEKI